MPDQNFTSWQPDRRGNTAQVPPGGIQTSMPRALWRGVRMLCPGCARSHIFRGFLTVAGPCPICDTPLDQARADDAPPYFTILLTAHLLVPILVLCDRVYAPRVWVEAAIWLPLTFCVTLGLLRPIKGATVALMLKLNMLRADEPA